MPKKRPDSPAKAPDATVPKDNATGSCPLQWKGSGKGGSTQVAVDDKNKVIYVKTKMEFTGPGATEDYAKAAKKQIEDSWSGEHTRNGEQYRVVTTVETKVNPAGSPTPGYDPIVVDPATDRMDQTLYGAGPGHQTPAAATDEARPRRIAHEYGHTLGIEDDYEETEEGCVPKDPGKKNNLMAETWPDETGKLPHPHPDHFDQALRNHGW